MKQMILAAILFAAASSASPQPRAADGVPGALVQAERDAMTRLAWMDGEWRGEAVMQTPRGPVRVTHTERAGTLLGGAVRLIEGRAYDPNGGTLFNALAVISYDPQRKAYRLTSHADGRHGDFPLTLTDNGYEWSVPAGPGRLNYKAVVQDGTWSEVGTLEMPNQPAREILRMSVRRIGASSWPAAGAVPPR